MPLNVAESTPSVKAEGSTQFGQNLHCWTPLEGENSLSGLDKLNTSPDDCTPARKKLGFEGLFDTTDPQVDNMDDVIGLCSGQFLTQGKMSSYMPKNDTPGQFPVNYGSQNSQDVIFDTPDTVILTENLNEVNDFTPNISADSKNISQRIETGSIDNLSQRNDKILVTSQ